MGACPCLNVMRDLSRMHGFVITVKAAVDRDGLGLGVVCAACETRYVLVARQVAPPRQLVLA